MKVTINVDCTPEEARKVMGLPDMGPMNEALVRELTARMQQALQAMDPETVLKTWLPATVQGWEQMQTSFWKQMAAGMDHRAGKKEKT